MTMPVGKLDPEKVALDRPIFDPAAFRLNDAQAAI